MKPNRIILALVTALAGWMVLTLAQSEKPGPKHPLNQKFASQQAKAYEQKGMGDSANVYYHLALQAFSIEGDWVNYARAAFSIANLRKNSRDMTGARYYLSKTDSILAKQNLAFDSLRAEIYHLKGVLNLMESRSDLARQDFLLSLDLKTNLYGENDSLSAPTFNNLGIIHYNNQDYEKALEYYRAAVKSAQKQKKVPNLLMPKFIENIGLVYAEMGDYNQAMENFSEALSQKLKFYGAQSVEVAQSYSNIANLEIDLSNYDIALDYLLKAEKNYISRFGPEYPDLDVVYQNMGKVYNSRSDYEKALNYFNKSIHLLRRRNPMHAKIPEIYLNIGYTYFVREEYHKALEYYRLSIADNNRASQNIKAYRNLARCFQSLHYYDSAFFYFNKSIRLTGSKSENYYEKATGLLYLGELHLKKGDTDEALRHYKQASVLLETHLGKKNRDLAYALLKQGELFLALNKPGEALVFFHEAVVALIPGYDESDVNSLPALLPQNPDYYLLSALEKKAQTFYRLWNKTGEISYLKKSSQSYQLASRTLDRIRSGFSSEESNILLSGNVRQILQEAMRTYVAFYEETGQPEYLEEAFRFSEKSKSALLRLAFHDIEELSYGTIPADIPATEKNLKNNISGYKKLIYNEIHSTAPDDTKIELWNNSIFRIERELDNLTARIKKDYPKYYERKYEGKGILVSELQARLKDEVILEYAFCDSILYVFVIGRNVFSLYQNAINADFFESLPVFLRVLQDGPIGDPNLQFSQFSNAALLFYNLLIKPAEAHLGKKKLIIIPDGQLAYLPFETFLSRPPENPLPDYRNLAYLINTNCIRYSYLASMLLSPTSKSKGMTNLGAYAPGEFTFPIDSTEGDSYRLTSLPPLPESIKEAQKVAAIMGGDVYTYRDASEGIFKNTAHQYRILHISTHALIDPLNPGFSRFLMYNLPDSTEDNFLNTYEIPSIQLEASLVVLNSCNTGTGRLYSGEGVFNLARGFLYTGVPTIVMTLWEIDDNIGIEIIQDFYKQLKKKMPTDEALRAAKLGFISGADKARAHPYFWSAYVTVGKSESIALKNPAFWNYGIVLTIGLAGMAAGLLFWRMKKKRINSVS